MSQEPFTAPLDGPLKASRLSLRFEAEQLLESSTEVEIEDGVDDRVQRRVDVAEPRYEVGELLGRTARVAKGDDYVPSDESDGERKQKRQEQDRKHDENEQKMGDASATRVVATTLIEKVFVLHEEERQPADHKNSLCRVAADMKREEKSKKRMNESVNPTSRPRGLLTGS
jgi:hypothetical protein